MKADMAEYLNALVSDDFDTFEQIISLQYRKFTRFYKLVKNYSSQIEKLRYSFTDPSSLDITLYMNDNTDMKELKNDIETSMERNGYEGILRIQKKNLHMSIILAET